MKTRNNNVRMKRNYGVDDYGFAYLPKKISIKFYHFVIDDEAKRGSCCGWCRSSSYSKYCCEKSWKKYRKHQYRD